MRRPDLIQQIASLRRGVVTRRIDLRSANDREVIARAEAEARAIEAAGGTKALGANADERERALILALAQDSVYQSVFSLARQIQADAERVEAELEAAEDERRAGEWAIRARLADALDHRGIQSDTASGEDDGAFDDSLDQRIIDRSTGEVIDPEDVPF